MITIRTDSIAIIIFDTDVKQCIGMQSTTSHIHISYQLHYHMACSHSLYKPNAFSMPPTVNGFSIIHNPQFHCITSSPVDPIFDAFTLLPYCNHLSLCSDWVIDRLIMFLLQAAVALAFPRTGFQIVPMLVSIRFMIS